MIASDISQTTETILPLHEHPTNNPALPCFEDKAYSWLKPRLRDAQEHWLGDELWKVGGQVEDYDAACRHMPIHEAETPDQHRSRIVRTSWEDFLGAAVSGFAGLLGDIVEQEGIHPEIKKLTSDVDMCGNRLDVFLRSCDEIAYRDGSVGIFVDHTPAQPNSGTGRPFLRRIERSDIIQLNYEFVDGKVAFTRVIVRETTEEPVGDYGTKTVTRYRVYKPGKSILYEIVRRQQGKDSQIVARVADVPNPVSIHQAKGQALKYVPLVLYSLTAVGNDAVTARLPFKPLMRLQDNYYQTSSGYYTVMDKCNIPVPVRKGLIMPGQTTEPPPMVFGGGFGMDLPKDGGFNFEEPTGTAISSTRQALLDLESQAVRYSLEILTDQSAATATEAELRSTPAKANLMHSASLKESAMEEILDYWAQYLGISQEAEDEEAKGGTLTISRDLIKQAMGSDLINSLSNLVERNQLSLRAFVQALIDGRVLPRDADADAEIAAIEKQKEQAMQSALNTMRQQAAITSAYPGEEEDEDNEGGSKDAEEDQE